MSSNDCQSNDCQSSAEHSTSPVPIERWGSFGPPPLFDGENTQSYDELLARISAAVKPADILEEIWVRDIVDLAWEALRLRKLKASLMTATSYRGLEEVLKPLVGFLQWEDLEKAWAARDKDAIKQVDELLASAGLTMNAVMAQTLSHNLDVIERIDRMIASAEARRNASLRELDRHRAWGQHLREDVRHDEAVDFKVIEAKPAKEKNVA
jgi:hypothetical protein